MKVINFHLLPMTSCASIDLMVNEPWYDGEEQRRRRLARGLNLQRLAEITEVSDAQLGNVERMVRQPSPATAARIAEALGCKIADLMLVRPATPEQVA